VSERWLADPRADVIGAGDYEGRRGLRLRLGTGEPSTVWFQVGERTLRVEAFILPAPPAGRREEVFRRSLAMALSSRGSVIRRFHEQMVSRARVLFDQLRSVFDGWIRETLEPMAEEIQEHKAMMETRLENLQRIGRSDDALDKRIEAIKHLYDGFAQDLTVLRNIHNALQYDPSAEHQAPSRLRLVSARPVTRAVPRG